ncbi:MAG: hypothetical protein K6G11_07310, partial [Lachnospiraceae bacterium]|nr:hypothetical protein [Lachnospiraceae bacterium]
MIFFIVNESSKSGKAKDIVNDVIGSFKKKETEYKALMTKHEGHANEISETIVRKEYNNYRESNDEDFKVRIVVLGGAGTINEVVDGIMTAKNESEEISEFVDKCLCLSVYPTGSGNDFIGGLHIERDKEALYDVVTDDNAEIKSVDIGKVTFSDGSKKYFAISSGMGMDALVCRKAETSSLKKFLNKIGLGKLTYIILTIQTIFSMDYSTCEIEYETVDEDGNVETKA